MRATSNERDTLRERLRVNDELRVFVCSALSRCVVVFQMATDAAGNERVRYEQRIDDLQVELRRVSQRTHSTSVVPRVFSISSTTIASNGMTTIVDSTIN
jgi:hypothetical protein